MNKKRLDGVLVVVFSLLLGTFAPSPALAVDAVDSTPGAECHRYTTNSLTWTADSTAFDFQNKQVTIKVNCDGKNAYVSFGNSGSGLYIAKDMQYRKVASGSSYNEWSPQIPLSSSQTLSNSFYKSSAQAVITNIEAGATYEVRANICRAKSDGSVDLDKCNCKNKECTEKNLWSIQAFSNGPVTEVQKFKTGDNIEVVVDGNVNVRESSGWTVIGTQPDTTRGKIVSDITLPFSTHKMWKVDFGTGVDGYAPEKYLTLASADTPKFKTGDNIEVVVDGNVNVRESSGWTVIGTQPNTTRGKIVSDITLPFSTHKMWRIDFGTGVDGYAPEKYLTLASVETLSVTMQASPDVVSKNGNSTLSWSSVGVDSCLASGGWFGVKDKLGLESVSVTKTKTYGLLCLGKRGIASSSVTITALEPSSESVCAPMDGDVLASDAVGIKFNPGHYIRVYQSKEKNITSYLDKVERHISEPEIQGVKARLTWRELEPREGEYDFDIIDSLLELVERHDKQLVFDIEDRSFWNGGCGVAKKFMPDYIVNAGYMYEDRIGQCMPNLVNKNYQDRFIALLSAIGEKYDNHPRLEGVFGLNESAMIPPGDSSSFSKAELRDAYIRVIKEAGKHFDHTVLIYALNFLHGDENLRRVIEEAIIPAKAALSWPDAFPSSEDGTFDPLDETYPQKWARANTNLIGLMPRSDNSFLLFDSVPNVFRYYSELGANHVFWQSFYANSRHGGFKSGFFEKSVLPTLRANGAKINTTCPSAYGVCLKTVGECS